MRIVVVGGGLAGLFAASELTSRGLGEVVVVERSPLPGGVTRTVRQDGFALEPGAGSFSLPHPHLGPILQRGGVPVVEAQGASTRYVHAGGSLVEVSPSPVMLMSPVLPLVAKLRALAEPVVRSGAGSDDESLADFCRRRFGDHAGELISWLMASGVYAGDPESLSVVSAFPALAALESEHGSVVRGALERMRSRSPRPRVHFPAGGMDALADALTPGSFLGEFEVASVHREGGRWVVEGPESITADAVVMAVAPHVASGLMEGRLGGLLGEASAAPVAVVGVGGASGSPLPPGFGALIGPGEGMVSLGLLFESSYAPSRAPDGSWLMKVIAGGARSPEVLDWDDDHLTDMIVDEAATVLGAQIDVGFATVIGHRPGIPQYGPGHGRWLADLGEGLADLPGLHVTGWGYRGVGVANLASDAVRVAEEVESGLSRSG